MGRSATMGILVSPMNPAYKEREIGYQLENSEADAVLIQRELLPLLQIVLSQKSLPKLKHVIVTGDRVPDGVPGATTFAKLLRESPSTRPAQVDIKGDDLVALPYSSGTTGFPKGTMLTHRNLVSNNLQFTTSLQTNITDVGLIFLPFYHIYGVMLTGSFLACGGTQVIMERFDLLQSLDLCEKHGVTQAIGLIFINAGVEPERFERDGDTIEGDPINVSIEVLADAFERSFVSNTQMHRLVHAVVVDQCMGNGRSSAADALVGFLQRDHVGVDFLKHLEHAVGVAAPVEPDRLVHVVAG